MSPDAGGAEQGVDHGVGEHVGVGVAGEAARVLDLDPAEDQAAALGEAVAVVADPDAHRDQSSPHRGRPSGSEPPLAALEDADLARPRARRGTRAPGRSRSRPARAGGRRRRARSRRRPRRTSRRRPARGVELADRLAQARGRDLDRDPALGDRLDRGLVVVARVALGQRPGAAPDLDQVGVGEDVEEARAGALGERLEVAAPDLVGVALALPDVPARVVDAPASPTKWTEPTT